MNRRSGPSSPSLWRSVPMCMSSVRVSPTNSYPHTCCSSSSRLTTRPLFCISIRSSSNSFRVSSTGRPFSSTSRTARFISSSPAHRRSEVTSGRGREVVRRTSARTRAHSSSTPKGFVM